jgi:Phosphoglycerol transferase and related proteins, alkaline phosphatase superfamily
VYFSQNQFLNHSAVNPVFSFLASLEKTASEDTVYNFYNTEEMAQLTQGLYDNNTTAGDTLLTTQRPNVVVILLESCGKMFMNVMPNLQKAANEGVDFTNCFGNSYRTDRGTVCSLSGYLSFPTMSVMKMSNKVGHISSIARSLQKEGYTTEYLYGGDINFTKMKGYLISTGFERLHWKQDYNIEEQNTSKWGVCDEITFKTLSEMVLNHHDNKPFLIGYSTLSSHEPWDVPVSKYKEKQYNGFYYVDQCIGRFLDEMKQSKQWDNLLVVFMPDHSSDFNEYDEQHPDRNRIPMIWTGGAVKEPKKLDMLCNQSDFAATLLGQMGLTHTDFTFSRDVTSRSYRYPFAIHMFNNGVSMTDSTGFMLYDLTAERITAKTSKDAERMARTAKAILQMASEDLKQLDEVK